MHVMIHWCAQFEHSHLGLSFLVRVIIVMSTTVSPTGLASPPHRPVLRPDLPQPDFVPHVETLSSSQSSPVKFKRIPATLTEIRALPEATSKAVDENFVQNHLSVAHPLQDWSGGTIIVTSW